MFKKILIFAVFIVALASLPAHTPALAQGDATQSATQAATQNAAAQIAAQQSSGFTVGQLLRLKTTIAFAWLRAQPSSTGGVIDTAQRSEFMIVVNNVPVSDGVQNWWLVARATGRVNGWVEQNSLEAATGPVPSATIALPTAFPPTVTPRATEAAQAWDPDTVLTFANGVPFIWLRNAALPQADIRATVRPGQTLIVQAGAQPTLDQFGQVWWLVRVPEINRIGWVEQKSLVLAPPTAQPSITNTPQPSATPTGTVAPSATPAYRAQPWIVPNVLFVKATVPYVWLRTRASSNAPVIDTVQLGGLVIVRGGPTWDGVQYWWQVQSAYTGKTGWVEEQAMQLAAGR